ncbi:MAG: hypothetical protein SV375_11345 [Thermodesulfobacteriota bacterium]|nr:hypothetical protein [Thermodesulfobacteriota bacterium]
MTQCKHKNLILIPPQNEKLRCRHCHLIIDVKEIGEGCCPECYEALGTKRRDFEKLKPEDDGKIRYRCEDCGVIIAS